MKEKEFAIDKKSRQSQSAQAEKRRMELEMSEIRDHLDIKDRRVNVLQRKVSCHVHLDHHLPQQFSFGPSLAQHFYLGQDLALLFRPGPNLGHDLAQNVVWAMIWLNTSV